MKRRLFLPLLVCFFSAPLFAQQSAMTVITNKCGSCHKPGGDAPFSLTSHSEVKKRTSTIKAVVESGYMPPWKADNSYCNYSNDKSLTREEKRVILDWIASGAKPEKGKTKTSEPGNTSNAALINSSDTVTIRSGFKYTIKGDNTERFVLFKVPFEYEKELNIAAIEFISDNKRAVHHVNYGVFSVDNAALDIKSGSKFIETDNPKANQAEYDHLTGKPVYYTGWIPGSSGESYPRNFGWVLPKRGVIIFTVHFSATPVDEAIDLGLRLYIGSNPINRKIKIISFGSGGIGEKDITPNFVIEPDKINRFELKMFTRSAQSVMYVWPHMHLLGKDFKAYAVTPSKDTIPLVYIPQWDYRWQELYRLTKLTHIPAGSTLVMESSYDNTASNPLNPNSPPKLILPTKNMESTKEMFTLLMIYVPYEKGDENIQL